MDGEHIERTLGQIEGKIDGLIERMDRQHAGMYGSEGLEPRVRTVEGDMRAIKAQAGLIAFVVSVFTAIGGMFLKK